MDESTRREFFALAGGAAVLTVTLRPEKPGELNRTLQILTDLRAESNIEFTAKANVVK